MITSEFQNICIGGVCSALPTKHIINMKEYGTVFGEDVVRKNEATTGVSGVYVCHETQTASDLCFAAAKRLMEEKGVEPGSVDILLYCAYSQDFHAPATAYVLQHRLGLSTDCIVLDIPLGCSGFVCGLQAMCSLLSCSTAQRGLLLVGDTTRRQISPLDKSILLFGEAGSAILVEKQERQKTMRFAIRSDGARYHSILMPGNGERVMENASHERTRREDGNVRSDYDMWLDGMGVFNFSITDVPRLILEFMGRYHDSPADFDCLLLHQANLFILKHLAKKVKFPMEKVPVSLDKYGNCGGATIPVTICDSFAGKEPRHLRALVSGFGVGLSWGAAAIEFSTQDVLPIFHTDEHFAERL